MMVLVCMSKLVASSEGIIERRKLKDFAVKVSVVGYLMAATTNYDIARLTPFLLRNVSEVAFIASTE